MLASDTPLASSCRVLTAGTTGRGLSLLSDPSLSLEGRQPLRPNVGSPNPGPHPGDTETFWVAGTGGRIFCLSHQKEADLSLPPSPCAAQGIGGAVPEPVQAWLVGFCGQVVLAC